MLKGRSLQDLVVELDRQNNEKVDYKAPTNEIRMTVATDGDNATFGIELGDDLNPEQVKLGANETFHQQIGTKLRIPRQYYKRMQEHEPELLAENVNKWMHREPPTNRLVRTLDGNARAYLSDSYRPLDNFELCEAIIPVIQEKGLKLVSTQVTESRLYLEAVSERIYGEVQKDDIVQAGVVISNSEVGQGSLQVEDLLFRLWCLNGCISGSALRKTHVGGKSGLLDDVANYRASTRRVDDAAFFMKVQDTVRNIFDGGNFEKHLSKFKRAAGDMIDKPEEAVKLVVQKLDLTEREGSGLMAALIKGGDLSMWGMSNAVTSIAHKAEDYDRNIEIQRMGQKVIELPKSDWKSIVVWADGEDARAA